MNPLSIKQRLLIYQSDYKWHMDRYVNAETEQAKQYHNVVLSDIYDRIQNLNKAI